MEVQRPSSSQHTGEDLSVFQQAAAPSWNSSSPGCHLTQLRDRAGDVGQPPWLTAENLEQSVQGRMFVWPKWPPACGIATKASVFRCQGGNLYPGHGWLNVL